MSVQTTFTAVGNFALVVLAVAAGSWSAATQGGGAVAVIDNDRIFAESTQGQAASQQIEANFSGWQQQITQLETELQGLGNQRQTQAGVMSADALRQLDAQIAQKQVDVQRMRDDAQRQFTAIRDGIIAELVDGTLTPLTAQVAGELGYPAVFNSQTPGLVYFNPTIDITDQMIARLNAMDQ